MWSGSDRLLIVYRSGSDRVEIVSCRGILIFTNSYSIIRTSTRLMPD